MTRTTQPGEPGEWMVNIVSTGKARESIIRLNKDDAFEIFGDLRKLMTANGWTLEMNRPTICKLSYKHSDMLFISVTCAAEPFDIRRPPQHWIERGITKAVAS